MAIDLWCMKPILLTGLVTSNRTPPHRDLIDCPLLMKVETSPFSEGFRWSELCHWYEIRKENVSLFLLNSSYSGSRNVEHLTRAKLWSGISLLFSFHTSEGSFVSSAYVISSIVNIAISEWFQLPNECQSRISPQFHKKSVVACGIIHRVLPSGKERW